MRLHASCSASRRDVTLASRAAIGLIFGLIAGACAFVIAYSEYRRNWAFHGNAGLAALRTAIVTFLLFLAAGIVLPWVFRRVLAPQ
jgi:hypothetical protein